MYFKIKIIFIFLVVFTSCKVNTTKNDISKVGIWIVEKIDFGFDPHDILVSTNTMTFDKSGVCNFPLLKYSEKREESINTKGIWVFISEGGKEYILIENMNKYFDGKYEISLSSRDGGKVLVLLLKSDKVNLQASTLSFFLKR